MQGKNEVVYRGSVVDQRKYKDFWADAVNGKVRVGRGSVVGEQTFMQWQDSTPLPCSSRVS